MGRGGGGGRKTKSPLWADRGKFGISELQDSGNNGIESFPRESFPVMQRFTGTQILTGNQILPKYNSSGLSFSCCDRSWGGVSLDIFRLGAHLANLF